MDSPRSPLFRQAAIDASSGRQDVAALSTHWRGVAVFTAIAFALIAALVVFVATVEYSPVRRLSAVVGARDDVVYPKAPLDGQISRLVGKDGALVVKLRMAPSALASMRPGVEIRLAFRDYPQERFGLFPARIESVAEVPSMGRERPQTSVLSEPTFVATATLPGPLRSSDGEALPLDPGMLAEALVPTEKRSVVAWMLDPIRHGFDDRVGRSARAASAGPRP